MFIKTKGAHKKFDKGSHAVYDLPAKKAVMEYLKKEGIGVEENSNRYGVDLLTNTGYSIEVEVKNNWKANQDVFPFSTVNLAARKKKFADSQWPTLFFLLRGDLKKAIYFPATALADLIPVEVPNKYIPKGELFFQVPVGLTTTATL